MKVSLIISVYKNTSFLGTVLNALCHQTTMPDEVIISEDGDSVEMRDFLCGYTLPNSKVVHLTQPDVGWRKNQALNRAILAASHDYLIFIDGDCVLHTRFVENHVRSANRQYILAGKRVKLGPLFSERIQRTPLPGFQRYLVTRWLSALRDGSRFLEEALYVPSNVLTRWLIRIIGISAIKGCNFSCYKEAMLAINGFDLDYVLPAVGEDHDLIWRFKGLGFRIVSVKHLTIQYHLHHAEVWTSQDENLELLRVKEASKQFRCLNGITSITSQTHSS